MTPRDVVLFLMLQGYTFDEAISVIKCAAEIAVNVSKALNEVIDDMRRLQEAVEGNPLNAERAVH